MTTAGRFRPSGVTLLAFLIVVLTASAVWACPNCKEALAANDVARTGVVKGYFYSILFMMGMPFALLTGFGAHMYRLTRKARAERDLPTSFPSPQKFSPPTHSSEPSAAARRLNPDD